MAPTGTRFEVEKFDGTGNFGLWQTRVKDLLAQQGCLKALRDAKPAKMDAEDWEELQLKAAGTIRLCLSNQVIYHVMDEDWPKKICDGGSSANVAARGDDSDSSSDVLVVSDRRSTKSEAWMLGSASSFHATPNREWFSSYKFGEFGSAYVAMTHVIVLLEYVTLKSRWLTELSGCFGKSGMCRD